MGVDFVGKTVTPMRVVDKYDHTLTFHCYLGDSSTVQVFEAIQRGRRNVPHRIEVGIREILTSEPVNAAGIAALTLVGRCRPKNTGLLLGGKAPCHTGCWSSLLGHEHFYAPVFCPTCLSRIWRLGLSVRISLRGGVAQTALFQRSRRIDSTGF